MTRENDAGSDGSHRRRSDPPTPREASGPAARARGPANRPPPPVGSVCRPALVSLLLVLALAPRPGCFGGRPNEAAIPADPALRAARIAELRQAIERDHATLEDLITRSGSAEPENPGAGDEEGGAVALHENPTLRAIAQRLTRQARLLARLETVDRKPDDDDQDETGPDAGSSKPARTTSPGSK